MSLCTCSWTQQIARKAGLSILQSLDCQWSCRSTILSRSRRSTSPFSADAITLGKERLWLVSVEGKRIGSARTRWGEGAPAVEVERRHQPCGGHPEHIPNGEGLFATQSEAIRANMLKASPYNRRQVGQP